MAAEPDPAFHESDGMEFKQVIVSGAALVFDVGGDQWQEETTGFHFRVREACAAHEFGTAHFEPFQGAGVVERAHLVGLAVADTELQRVAQGGESWIVGVDIRFWHVGFRTGGCG